MAFALAILAGTAAQSPPYVRETALARVARARAVAADPQIVKAVLAKNELHETLDDIRRKDKDWADNPRSLLRKTLSGDACAQRLRELTRDDPVIVEVILMDAQGANVCVSRETADYWQGDEAKFQKSFGADREVFVDEPAFDASTATHAIQLSVVVTSGQARIGALTLTLKVRKEDVAAGATR